MKLVKKPLTTREALEIAAKKVEAERDSGDQAPATPAESRRLFHAVKSKPAIVCAMGWGGFMRRKP